MDINKIIQYLDNYLEKNNLPNIDAVNANALLAKAKLLGDSQDRPGKPLRDLLRKGGLPHAYQPGGDGTQWLIPRLKRRNLKPIKDPGDSTEHQQTPEPTDLDLKLGKTATDGRDISRNIAEARLKYKPDKIKYLLIAEAPPDSLDRFFYYENVKQHDYLFLGIAEALYPELKAQYLQSNRRTDLKTHLLNRFVEDGFYLLDLADLPLSLLKGRIEDQLSGLIKRIKPIADTETNIVLIKANVYDIAYNSLVKDGYKHIANIRIPFPGQGWQRKFQIEFRRALAVLGKEVS